MTAILLALVLASGGPAHAMSKKKPVDYVWVAKPDGAKSCQKDSGVPLTEGSEALRAAGIDVAETKKGSDGKMHAQMCGMPSGTTNVYRIPEKDAAKAASLGFTQLRK